MESVLVELAYVDVVVVPDVEPHPLLHPPFALELPVVESVRVSHQSEIMLQMLLLHCLDTNK